MVQSSDELRVLDFSVSFPTVRIQAHLRVAPQERLVLSGASGSGKSTLLRFLAGLDLGAPAQGQVWFGGRELTQTPPERRDFGIVTQQSLVFPHLSVLDNAAFGLKMRGFDLEARRAAVLPWLERCGLGRLVNSRAEILSGGEKQRLSLVRAWCWKPLALLLDEPFSALDASLRREMAEWVIELHGQSPIPLIFVTHDREEAFRVGTREVSLQYQNGIHLWRDQSLR